MADALQKKLDRWVGAGILDAVTATRIRSFEETRGTGEKFRWPVVLALAFGGILLGAGVLLFVAAHWDELSPTWRFTLVLLLVAAFPVAGALTAERFQALSQTFYAVGTVCCGAGIFLAAQIFNLQEHWPNGILLWAVGALAGWVLLRNWSQAMLLALLVPGWLIGEWVVRKGYYWDEERLLWEGLLLLAIAYLTAKATNDESHTRTALAWIGGLAILPMGVMAFVSRGDEFWFPGPKEISLPLITTAWCVAIGGPLVLAFAVRRSAAWMNAVATVWVLIIGTFHSTHAPANSSLAAFAWNSVGPYLWAGLGAAGLVAWGIVEHRRERVNLGVAGFALTVAIFYFSDVMDKLGRSASLIGMGALLLVGGWGLEKARRKLVARAEGRAA